MAKQFLVLCVMCGATCITRNSWSEEAAPQNKLKIGEVQYSVADLGTFAPSGAIYFMDGESEATVKIRGNGEQVTFKFKDQATCIAASAPTLYDKAQITKGMFTPAPPPLKPVAFFPTQIPDTYRRETTLHQMQVLSMNMQDKTSGASLLIGIPYAEAYPKLFSAENLFNNARDASSYGVVQSLTEFHDHATKQKEVNSNGYPARSCFAVFHIIKTKHGAFFNKKPTVMELEPNPETGKLALSLPPIPFSYKIINAPIPLFDVEKPNGEAVADVVDAKHHSSNATKELSQESWPLRQERR